MTTPTTAVFRRSSCTRSSTEIVADLRRPDPEVESQGPLLVRRQEVRTGPGQCRVVPSKSRASSFLYILTHLLTDSTLSSCRAVMSTLTPHVSRLFGWQQVSPVPSSHVASRLANSLWSFFLQPSWLWSRGFHGRRGTFVSSMHTSFPNHSGHPSEWDK